MGAALRAAIVVLWAWHGAYDLSALDPARHEVAVLTRTVTLHARGASIDRRRSPLRVAPGTRVTAVVRIERDPALSVQAAHERIDETVAAVLAGYAPEHRALQIDFDAPRSFRPFYRDLLARVRAGLPRDARLSMTALGSWCTADRWLDGLPVDEIVPMLFAMGRGTAPVHRVLAATRTLPEPRCRDAMGVSMRESLPHLPRVGRLYLWAAPHRAQRAEIDGFVAHPWATLRP